MKSVGSKIGNFCFIKLVDLGVAAVVMKLMKIIFVSALLCCSVTLQAQSCHSKLINWSDYDKTRELLKNAYQRDYFRAVDHSLHCLTNAARVFSSGESGSSAVYVFFHDVLDAPGVDYTDSQRIDRWQKAIHGSNFAQFAEIVFTYAQAWNSRGGKFVSETSNKQLREFEDKLLQAEAMLLSNRNLIRDTPLSYNLLMDVELLAKGGQVSGIDVFAEGVSRWPNHYNFYELFLRRHVPKWGGSWEIIEKFISYWAAELDPAESDSIYARFYGYIHCCNQTDPRETEVDWGRLKPALISLYSQYPAQKHFARAASYACIFGDQGFYNQLVDEQGATTSTYWLGHSSKENCDRYFDSQTDQKTEFDW